MTMPVVIFDFDGVLADTLQDLLDFSRIVCARLGYPCTPGPADLEALDPMSFHSLGRQLGVPEACLEDYVQGCFELFLQRAAPSPTFPGMQAALQRCAQACRMGVVTGNVTAAVREFLAFHGIAEYFPIVLGADLPGTRVEKIQKAVELLSGSARERVWVVGDSVSDIRAARQAGVSCIAVGWGHQSLQKLGLSLPGSHCPHA